MAEPLRDFIQEIDRVRRVLNRLNGKGKQLHSQSQRDSLRDLANRYFKELRPLILPADQGSPEVLTVDRFMQELVEACHRRGAVKSYIDLLNGCKVGLVVLDTHAIASSPMSKSTTSADRNDERIAVELEKTVPSAANAYRQALRDLAQTDRLSWRGPATDLRESLRETLDHLAPDATILAQKGFKLEPDTKGPTMKQKARYVLRSRSKSKGQNEAAETAIDAIEESIGAFVRSVYTRSSISTHTHTGRDEVLRVHNYVRVVLAELLAVR